jgi:hypothetical protein
VTLCGVASEGRNMDTDKEGTLTPSAQVAIGDAAKANVNAAVEVAKSAVTAFVDAFTGEPQKPKKPSTRKKAAAKGARSKRGQAKGSSAGRKSVSAAGRKATRKSAAKRRPSTSSDAAARRSTRKTTTTRAPRKSAQAKRIASKSKTSKTRGRPPKPR